MKSFTFLKLALLVFAIAALFAQATATYADGPVDKKPAGIDTKHEGVSNTGAPTRYIERKGVDASIENGNLDAADRMAPMLDGETSVEIRRGGMSIDTVIGADDRVRINPTTSFPWRAIADLEIWTANNTSSTPNSGCTGWFIGPHTLATAGHCVYQHDKGGWIRKVRVIPGRNGTGAGSEPFGSQISYDVRSVRGWTNDRDSRYDYGAIILPNNNLGNAVGWFGFASLSNSSLDGMMANLSGYPGDKPNGTQWFHSRRITDVEARRVYYDIDTFNGQSGSPVWRLLNGQRHGVAVHTNGTGGCGGSENCGTRITQPVFDNFLAWKQ